MALSFDATYYMSARPDVLTAYIGAGAEVGTGMSWAQFAEQHYNDFGWKEGYNPNAIFDTTEYLAANIDVLNAGVNPFQHYLQFGAYEKRAPSDSFISFEDFDWETYLAANSDLTDAGILTAEAAYGHYVVFGQFEVRDGKPEAPVPSVPGETYTLTRGLDKYTGTANDDVFEGEIQHLNGFDHLIGGGGHDVLNLHGDGAVKLTTQKVEGIETINIIGAHAPANDVDVSGFKGAKEIWQVGRNGNVTGLADGQTAGFKGSDGATITAAKGSTSINLALDQVKESASFTFASADTTSKVATVSVEGSVAKGVATGTGAANAGYKTGIDLRLDDSVKTLNLALNGENVDLSVYDTNATPAGTGQIPDKLVTLDASESTAGIWLDASGLVGAGVLGALKTVSFGSGADYIQLTQTSLKEKAATLDLGAGNDTVEITLNAPALADATTIAITGGEGRDSFVFLGSNANINATDAAAQALLAANMVTITDFGNGADVLNLTGSNDKAWYTQNAVNAFVENFVNNTADATLVQVLYAISGNFSGADAFKFDFGDDAYVFINNGNDDIVIQLAGVSESVLTDANVVFA